MEATLRPYDRGEEVTPFATLGLYHAYRALPSYAYPLCFLLFLSYCCSEGRRGRSKNEFYGSFREQREAWRGRAASAAYPARLNSQM